MLGQEQGCCQGQEFVQCLAPSGLTPHCCAPTSGTAPSPAAAPSAPVRRLAPALRPRPPALRLPARRAPAVVVEAGRAAAAAALLAAAATPGGIAAAAAAAVAPPRAVDAVRVREGGAPAAAARARAHAQLGRGLLSPDRLAGRDDVLAAGARLGRDQGGGRAAGLKTRDERPPKARARP